jgi:hypothetical protein
MLTCKPEYAYGQRAQDKIPANSTLKFEVELLSFSEKDPRDMTSAEKLLSITKWKQQGNDHVKAGDFSSALHSYNLVFQAYNHKFCLHK